MDVEEILSNARTLTLVVDGTGVILHAVGGFGGFIDPKTALGTTVFEHVAPDDVDELATYFLESVEEEMGVAAQPMPFRVNVLDADGAAHPSDVIPTGIQLEDGTWLWTVVVVPTSLSGSISRSLDLEVAGASRHDVRRMLCEELAVENTTYTSRWALIDLTDDRVPDVVTSRGEDIDVAEAISTTIIANQWKPWTGLAEGEIAALDTTQFPDPLGSLMAGRGWQRSVVAPVHVDGELAAVFLMIGVVPDAYDPLEFKLNQTSRINTLVRAAAMLTAKWRQNDQLIRAANSDPLTGLANRDAFFEALESEHQAGALLYLDIDHFKAVNDGYGHSAGDRVLVEIAERISDACRDDDIAARVGGDEFVVLLRRATVEVAQEIAERIIASVAAPMPHCDGPDCVSISIGLAMVGNGERPLDAADRAMLSAKRKGRGRVAISLTH